MTEERFQETCAETLASLRSERDELRPRVAELRGQLSRLDKAIEALEALERGDDVTPFTEGTPEAHGSNGGKARAAKLTPDERREIARSAARARWNAIREAGAELR